MFKGGGMPLITKLVLTAPLEKACSLVDGKFEAVLRDHRAGFANNADADACSRYPNDDNEAKKAHEDALPSLLHSLLVGQSLEDFDVGPVARTAEVAKATQDSLDPAVVPAPADAAVAAAGAAQEVPLDEEGAPAPTRATSPLRSAADGPRPRPDPGAEADADAGPRPDPRPEAAPEAGNFLSRFLALPAEPEDEEHAAPAYDAVLPDPCGWVRAQPPHRSTHREPPRWRGLGAGTIGTEDDENGGGGGHGSGSGHGNGDEDELAELVKPDEYRVEFDEALGVWHLRGFVLTVIPLVCSPAYCSSHGNCSKLITHHDR